jgi:hypothetical protein
MHGDGWSGSVVAVLRLSDVVVEELASGIPLKKSIVNLSQPLPSNLNT